MPLGDENIASSRLRCYAVQKKLERDGFSSRVGFDSECDILFIQKKADDAAIDAAYLCKKKSKTLIYDIDDFPDSPVFRKNSRLLVSLADAVTVATPEQKSFLLKTCNGLDPAKVFVLRNTIDYGLLDPVKKLHKSDGKLKIVWFGNIENFPAHLVDSICAIQNSEFHAITNFSQEITKRYPKCHFQVWSYDGFSPALTMFDVCVLSHQGSEIHDAKNANKMIAAIAHGIPVVASQTPDYERLAVLAGIESYLFHDTESLQISLEKLRDATARNLYLQLAQPVIWKHFNIDAVVPMFLDVVNQAIECRARNDVSALLKKLAPFYRRLILRKKIASIKSIVGLE